MGFISSVKESLKRNYPIIVLYILLSAVSAILVNSAMIAMMYDHSKPFDAFTSSDMIKHMSFLFLGLMCLIFIPAVLKNKFVFRILACIYIFSVFVCILGLPIFGSVVNGAKRWIVVLGVSIQPSEFFKLGIILLGAFVGDGLWRLRKNIANEKNIEKIQSYQNSIRRLFAFFWIISAISILFMCMSSLSTAIIYSVFVFTFTFILKPEIKYFFKWIFGGIVFIVFSFLVMKYTDNLPQRFSTWDNRFETAAYNKKNPFEINDQNRQQQFAKIALANGKWFGVGFNKSKMKSSLSMAYSDYIMSIAYEEWGIFSIIIIIAIFVFWMIFSRNIAKNTDNMFFKYTAYGIGSFYPIQVIINFFVASGYMSTGQPLPIIGYGGSSILGASLSLTVLAVIHNISLKKKLLKDDTKSDN